MSNKLQKRRSPLKEIGRQPNLPDALASGTPYEDIPLSPPGKLPSYGSTLSRRSIPASDPSIFPWNDRVTVFDASHYTAKRPTTPPAQPKAQRPDETTNKRATSMPPSSSRISPEQDGVLRPWSASTKWPQTGRSLAADSLSLSQSHPPYPDVGRRCCKPESEAQNASPRQNLSADRDHQGCGPNCIKFKRETAPTADDLSHEIPPTSMSKRALLPPTDVRLTSQSATHNRASAPARFYDPQRAFQDISSRALRTCLKCGKYKRPVSLPNQAHQRTASNPHTSVPSTSDWPLPSTGLQAPRRKSPDASPHKPFERSEYLEKSGFSPLITKTPSNFESARKLSPHPSYARMNSVPSREGSLIRRISSVMRPAQIPRRSDFNHPHQSASTPQYLTLPISEHPDRPGSPFSFVVSDFEMAPVSQSTDAEQCTADDTGHEKMRAVQLTHGALTEVQHTTDQDSRLLSADAHQPMPQSSLSETATFSSGNEEILSRSSSVMQRAMSGSIRRFKSLRGVHHGWYRDDLTIEGYNGGEDGLRSHPGAERQTLNAY